MRERRSGCNKIIRKQILLSTKEAEQGAKGWGTEVMPKTTKIRSRAGELATLKSNTRYWNPE